MQRPDHLVIQAVKHGHTVDVYTSGATLWKKPQLPPALWKSGTRIRSQRVGFIDHLLLVLIRLLRSAGAGDGLARRWGERQEAQKVARWESLWNGDTKENYDAVIFCGRVPCPVKRKRKGVILVYDCMDQWDGFPDAPVETLEYEDSLARIADMIYAVTPELAERLSRKHGNKCHVVANGCDYDHFCIATKKHRPGAWKPNAPIIGYAGMVGAWFDWDAVIAIANGRPDATVWIIGLVHAETRRNLPPNVTFEGFVPYERLPECYAAFDVAIIPFRGELLAKGISPIKIYEYLAAGKPVVSSRMPDAVQLESPGIVEVAATPEEFARRCSHLLDAGYDQQLKEKRCELARSHTWAVRWKLCESLLKQPPHSSKGPLSRNTGVLDKHDGF